MYIIEGYGIRKMLFSSESNTCKKVKVPINFAIVVNWGSTCTTRGPWSKLLTRATIGMIKTA